MAELIPNETALVLELERRVARLERLVQAQRRDFRDTGGLLRVRVGLQDDGRYGLRVWTSAGALVIDSTTS